MPMPYDALRRLTGRPAVNVTAVRAVLPRVPRVFCVAGDDALPRKRALQTAIDRGAAAAACTIGGSR